MPRQIAFLSTTAIGGHIHILNVADKGQRMRNDTFVFETYAVGNVTDYGFDGVQDDVSGIFTVDLPAGAIAALTGDSLYHGVVRSGTNAADTGGAINIGEVDIPNCSGFDTGI